MSDRQNVDGQNVKNRSKTRRKKAFLYPHWVHRLVDLQRLPVLAELSLVDDQTVFQRRKIVGQERILPLSDRICICRVFYREKTSERSKLSRKMPNNQKRSAKPQSNGRKSSFSAWCFRVVWGWHRLWLEERSACCWLLVQSLVTLRELGIRVDLASLNSRRKWLYLRQLWRAICAERASCFPIDEETTILIAGLDSFLIWLQMTEKLRFVAVDLCLVLPAKSQWPEVQTPTTSTTTRTPPLSTSSAMTILLRHPDPGWKTAWWRRLFVSTWPLHPLSFRTPFPVPWLACERRPYFDCERIRPSCPTSAPDIIC